jgi:hydrogenase nickel incorporation protein HypA/HybF
MLFNSHGEDFVHELGIAQSILELVQQYVPESQAAAIRGVKVKVGTLAGVVPESLDFSFQAIVAETPWSTAKLEIEQIRTLARCNGCGNEFEIDEPAFICPACGGLSIKITAGRELQVSEIEMDDDQAGEL